jgi:hypothetical protein
MDSEIAEQMWLATMQMAIDLKKREFVVDEPFRILRTAKVLLNECRVNPAAKHETLAQGENLILDAQKKLYSIAQPLGREYLDEWNERMKEAMRGEREEDSKLYRSHFYPGLPRDRRWIRFVPPEALTPEKLEEITRGCGAEVQAHEGRHVLISGKKECLKRVLEAITPYFQSREPA